MKKWLAMFLALGIISCDRPNVGPEGYTFPNNTYRIAERPIKVVLYPDYKSLTLAYKVTHKGRKLDKQEDLHAFTIIGDVCTIHVIDPKARIDSGFYGHELVHCLYGDWHPNQPTAG